jgi:apolipoprotein N-acyltransferase
MSGADYDRIASAFHGHDGMQLFGLPRPPDWLVAIAVAASVAVIVAAPWLRQELVACEWIGVAAALLLATNRRGWRHETVVLAAAALALSIAFHWAPHVLAHAMRKDVTTGLLFTVPVVLWDACRLALPFWLVGRTVTDPRNAWLPAGLAAVTAEAFLPGVFPWKLGYSQIAWPVTVQAADIFGAEWPTFVLFAHAGAIVTLVLLPRGRPGVGGCASIALCLANAAYGAAAMQAWTTPMATAATVKLALAQVDPDDDDAIDELRRLTAQARTAPGGPPDLVCWPECSGGSYEEGLDSLADPDAVLARSREPRRGLRPLPEPFCPLLLGGRIYRGYPEKPRDIFQAALLLDTSERIVGCYHKRHLMPFGEYVPGASVVPEIRLHFPLDVTYDVGTEATVLPCGDRIRLGVMLCYEDMVPAAARSLVEHSANLLVSLINGAAFTEPLTLTQHRLLAQLRAVESRRCFVRCAATGETCVISPVGTIAARLPLHVRDVLVAEVPLLEGRTVASRIGWLFPFLCGGLLAAWLVRGRRRAGQAA